MKCPNCLVESNIDFSFQMIGADNWTAGFGDGYGIKCGMCPNSDCKKMIMYLMKGKVHNPGHGLIWLTPGNVSEKLIVPKGINRTPIPKNVPQDIANSYLEACLVLPDSPQASAALSRRCLQHLLREHVGVKHADLFDEIEEAINKGNIPSFITDELHSIRHIGKFAAHPIKSKHTGEIISVEPGEAENNLDVLESLFDFYFVQPEKAKARKEALSKKIESAVKKTSKTE